MIRIFIRTIHWIVFVVAVSKASAQPITIDHWETIIYDSTVWKYFPGQTDPGSTWKDVSFNDNLWPSGSGGVGYGDNDDRTIISSVMSVFLRKKFNVMDTASLLEAVLHVDYDDGFIAYLNGTEIARAFMGPPPVPYNQNAQGLHEALLYQGQPPEGFILSKQLLRNFLIPGENLLAIEVHNESITSSDLSSRVFFSVGTTDNSQTYYTTPSWFQAPEPFVSSNLPIVVINTNGQSIPDEPRIMADMGIIDNGPGVRNFVEETFNDYNGKISIELRGESSQSFPKKSYRLETVDVQGVNLNAALLGMPPDNDWILYAPYTDKTMLRDVITFQLANEMGRYAPRCRFVEVVLNNDYHGVYVLMENIKRDPNRVNMAKITPLDLTGDDLTGGYLLRVDKWDNNDYPLWTSVPNPQLAGENAINFQYHDPKGDELQPVQQQYIQNFIFQFESALSGGNFTNLQTGYWKYIDVSAFIDFMLMTEIGKNIDGYIFSTYLYKDKDSDGGKLVMGPLWDFNLAYGNLDYLANSQFAPGWTFDDPYRMYWFRRLMQDISFANESNCRWSELRQTLFSNNSLLGKIDSIALLLEEAQVRNYKRWPILGVYVWPNQFVGQTYGDEIGFLKQWISDRLEWMEDNFPGDCDIITSVEAQTGSNLRVYPNPSHEVFYFDLNLPGNASLRVFNMVGEMIFSGAIHSASSLWQSIDHSGQAVADGVYMAEVRSPDGKTLRAKLVKSR